MIMRIIFRLLDRQQTLGIDCIMQQLRPFVLTVWLAGSLALVGCAGSSSRINDYLTGFKAPLSEAGPVALPLTVGLLIALPENELGNPTTPSKESLTHMGLRIQKELQESSKIRVERIYPTIIIPSAGIHALDPQQLRDVTQGRNSPKLLVVVATSRPARRVYFWRLEDQLFARMDVALVDLSTGQALAADAGQDDYVLSQSTYFNAFSYPRLYYRTFTFAGPFTVVEGDPYKALGEAAFSGAADQIGMKLRQRLDPAPPGI